MGGVVVWQPATELPTRTCVLSVCLSMAHAGCWGRRLRAKREAGSPAVAWGRGEFRVKCQVVREVSQGRDAMCVLHLRGKGVPQAE